MRVSKGGLRTVLRSLPTSPLTDGWVTAWDIAPRCGGRTPFEVRKTLNELSKAGFVERDDLIEGERRRYRITDRGRQELRRQREREAAKLPPDWGARKLERKTTPVPIAPGPRSSTVIRYRGKMIANQRLWLRWVSTPEGRDEWKRWSEDGTKPLSSRHGAPAHLVERGVSAR